MSNAENMGWPVPTEDKDPWFVEFDSMVKAMDSSAFASRDDNELIIAGPAKYTFDAAGDLLSWQGIQEFVSPFSGYACQLSSGSVTVRNGETVYVNLSRAPTDDCSIVAGSASVVPNHDDSFALCVRREDNLYFRNGVRVIDGQAVNILTMTEDENTVLNIANRQTHDDTVPLSVGAIAFDPSDYSKAGMSMAVVFRVNIASGNEGVLVHVALRNYTDDEDVVVFDTSTSTLTTIEQQLVLGTGVGEIDSVEHIYEVLLYLDAAPGLGDGVELYSAEIRIENTLPPPF